MLEVAGAVAGRHGVEIHTRRLQRPFLEDIDVLRALIGPNGMPLHVQLRRRQGLAHGIGLVEAGDGRDLVRQTLGHGLAGLVMDRVALQHIRVQRPVLVEL